MREPSGTRIGFPGRYLRVAVETWPGIGEWEVAHQPGAAALLAITPREDVVLVRQFRPPVRDDLVEIPAGLLDVDGEDAMTCAVRELREETGFEASGTRFLGGVYVSPGSTDHYVHLFVARTAAEPVGEGEPGIEVVLRPFAEMVEAAAAGRVRDAKTALALLMAARQPAPP
ncbi:MAG: NUDIX hydrolase [Actinomycetota bacterium]